MVDIGELIGLADNETLFTLVIRIIVLYLVIVSPSASPERGA
jgi:hypothetical protein